MRKFYFCWSTPPSPVAYGGWPDLEAPVKGQVYYLNYSEWSAHKYSSYLAEIDIREFFGYKLEESIK